MPPITPPWSPPSPTMSMESISGSPLLSDVTLQQFSRKIKIMIVDDNSINLTILSRVLHVHFAETVELSAVMTSGVAALERLSKEEFDLILMDIDMPVLTGVETTIAIRQPTPEYPILEQNQKVPIIAVTTSDGEIQRELYQHVGMSCCVSKPIVVSKLRFAIEDAVNSTGHLAVG
ncbi:sensitivity to red-light reduced protein [Entomortierella chlamydospora]|uniref:Sensitivity to red-light reduced protein n=1 Tax=Entomortierella chlamydospora TaxID=101097 RepID=A0A9P6N0V3_9FUNG|nr:sensitivity to red-light reduced protein [Entomortierella chlamydospora]